MNGHCTPNRRHESTQAILPDRLGIGIAEYQPLTKTVSVGSGSASSLRFFLAAILPTQKSVYTRSDIPLCPRKILDFPLTSSSE